MKRLYFALTKRCNLRCTHCFNDSGNGGFDELTTKQVHSVINSALASSFTEVQFTGGEALVREDIFEIINFSHDVGMHVLLQTNGVIDDSILPRLLELDTKRTKFIVSIDGIETNDKFRGASVTETALRSVEILSSRFPVRINTLLSSGIKDAEIKRLINFAKQTGATSKFNPVIPCGRGSSANMIKPKDYFEKMAWLENQIIKVRKNFTYDAQAKSFYDNENCPVRKNKGIFIAANGDCYPCGFLEGISSVCMGNVLGHNNGFGEIQKNYPKECSNINNKCIACNFYINKNCFGGCPARIYALHGNFKGCEIYCMKKHGGEWTSHD